MLKYNREEADLFDSKGAYFSGPSLGAIIHHCGPRPVSFKEMEKFENSPEGEKILKALGMEKGVY